MWPSESRKAGATNLNRLWNIKYVKVTGSSQQKNNRVSKKGAKKMSNKKKVVMHFPSRRATQRCAAWRFCSSFFFCFLFLMDRVYPHRTPPRTATSSVDAAAHTCRAPLLGLGGFQREYNGSTHYTVYMLSQGCLFFFFSFFLLLEVFPSRSPHGQLAPPSVDVITYYLTPVGLERRVARMAIESKSHPTVDDVAVDSQVGNDDDQRDMLRMGKAQELRMWCCCSKR